MQNSSKSCEAGKVKQIKFDFWQAHCRNKFYHLLFYAGNKFVTPPFAAVFSGN
jgi:hypothetical protein